MKNCIFNLLWGVVLTGVTMLIPYQYCMEGPGRGFPFAVYSPNCGAWFSVFAFDDSRITQILDAGGFVADVLVWGAAVTLVRAVMPRRRVQIATDEKAAG